LCHPRSLQLQFETAEAYVQWNHSILKKTFIHLLGCRNEKNVLKYKLPEVKFLMLPGELCQACNQPMLPSREAHTSPSSSAKSDKSPQPHRRYTYLYLSLICLYKVVFYFDSVLFINLCGHSWLHYWLPHQFVNPAHLYPQQRPLRAICGHWLHHSCLDRLLTTPPFGKACSVCADQRRIWHSDWPEDPRQLEKAWQCKQARLREMADVSHSYAVL